MSTAIITQGVKISVKTEFLPHYSNANRQSYAFSYRVRIENTSEHTVQLIRRHWLIYNAQGNIQEVEGEGVIGLQPVLEPGQIHEYESGCNLPTYIGKIEGTYLMERLLDGKQFRVKIPDMQLIVPYLLN